MWRGLAFNGAGSPSGAVVVRFRMSPVRFLGPVKVQIQVKIHTWTGEQNHAGLQTAAVDVWTLPWRSVNMCTMDSSQGMTLYLCEGMA